MKPPPDLASLSSAEKDALILTLLARIEELMAHVAALEAENAALRAKLDLPPKTPDNSSTPPAQGHKANTLPSRRGKGKAHAGAHRPLHPNPTRRREVLAQQCPQCRAEVSGVGQVAKESYDRIEIPQIQPDVTRVTLYGGICPCCARPFKALPPAGLEPGSPFGPNRCAFVLYLRAAQAVSYERLARLMSELLGVTISEGALVTIMEDSRAAFARQREAIRARLLAGTILEADETSMRVGKRTWWGWVFHHADSACFVIAPSRGRAVVEHFLGPYRPEFWVSDRLATQMGWATKEHQVCLAHLIRDAQYAIDAGDTVFAPGVQKLLRQACAIGRRRDRLAPTHRQGEKLRAVIKKDRQNLFVFVTNRAIPPTNNGSERALRPCVIFRKVTNCFRAEWAAELYADIRSVRETARRRSIPALEAIRRTLDPLPLTATFSAFIALCTCRRNRNFGAQRQPLDPGQFCSRVWRKRIAGHSSIVVRKSQALRARKTGMPS